MRAAEMKKEMLADQAASEKLRDKQLIKADAERIQVLQEREAELRAKDKHERHERDAQLAELKKADNSVQAAAQKESDRYQMEQAAERIQLAKDMNERRALQDRLDKAEKSTVVMSQAAARRDELQNKGSLEN